MQLLQELYKLIKVSEPKKSKKAPRNPPALFIGAYGGTLVDQPSSEGEGDGEGGDVSESAEPNKMKVTITPPKQRNKAVNDILSRKKGGRMKSLRDYDRNKQKQSTRDAVHED